MKTLVVGAGAIARHHVSCLTALPMVDAVAICDASPATARAMADRFGLPMWSDDLDDLLRRFRPEVVHVTTPPGAHAALARRAIEAGAHVIIEKPLTTCVRDSVELLDYAREHSRRVVEDYNYVFNEPVQRCLSMIGDGSLGDVVHVSIEIGLSILVPGSPYLDRGSRSPYLDMPGGAIADFLPHLASLCHAFVGEHREVSTAWWSRSGVLAADEFRALVRGSGASAALSFSAASQPDAFRLTVHGTRARARADIFESRFSTEGPWPLPKPLVPVANGLRESRSAAAGSLRGLLLKLNGGPAAYQGLYTLVTRTYEALAAGTELPVTEGDVRAVNMLVADLVRTAP